MTDPSEAVQTPLKDLLARVPKDAVATYEVHPTHHMHIPYGRHCHDALEYIATLEQRVARYSDLPTLYGENERLKAEKAALEQRVSELRDELRHWVDKVIALEPGDS